MMSCVRSGETRGVNDWSRTDTSAPPSSAGRTGMPRVRSLAFDAAWIIWTLILGAAIPVLWAAGTPARRVRQVTRLWSRGTLRLLSAIVGLRYAVTGRAHLPNGPCLIVCNHQSAWETVAALHLFPEVAIVAKRQLLRIPILGWYLKHSRMIIIDRESGASAMREMIKQGAAAISHGRSILIFPEGTRIKPGLPVTFRRGVEHLYGRLHVPLLPLAVNSGRFWRSTGPRKSGTIAVSILECIAPGLAPSAAVKNAEVAIDCERRRIGG